jgi:ABC-type transport system involved in multi-copper enzyme maturation permease subunit
MTWLRQHFGWSNSGRSWAERLAGAVLVAGAVGALLGRGWFSAVQQVVVWGLLVVATAVLLRHGWLKLFGPVLFYDMIRSARRGRYMVLRTLYAGLLFLILYATWLNTRHHFNLSDRRVLARMGEMYFQTFMAGQLIAVAVLTPAYVAGAVADEKDRKTLDFLLATDLRNREIVLGKLMARLANLSLFVLTGLPILGLIQFLGGVDPNLVLAGGAFTALTMAGLGALSILNSTYARKPRDAIVLSYLGMVAYLAVSFLLFWCQRNYPATMRSTLWLLPQALNLGDVIGAFNSGNLVLVMGKIADSGTAGTLAREVPVLLQEYALFHAAVFFACTAWSVCRLRAVALKQAHGLSRRGRQRGRRRAAVFSPPMIWKEVCVEGGIRFHWLGWIAVVVLVVATLLPGILILIKHFDELLSSWSPGPGVRQPRLVGNLALEMNSYVQVTGTLVFCLTLLGVAARASTSIGGEREHQTLDGLLTSPLDSGAIVYAKWLGALFSVRWAWLRGGMGRVRELCGDAGPLVVDGQPHDVACRRADDLQYGARCRGALVAVDELYPAGRAVECGNGPALQIPARVYAADCSKHLRTYEGFQS